MTLSTKLRARHIHLFETLFENTVGYLMNLALVLIVYNWIFGYNIALHDNAMGGIIFFIVAWVRKYVIRRWFSGMIDRLYERKAEQLAGADVHETSPAHVQS